MFILERYQLLKVGPVISVNHGIGIPSFSIVFQEICKILYYAKAKNFVFFRIGTCGGLGLKPGNSFNLVFDNIHLFFDFNVLLFYLN